MSDSLKEEIGNTGLPEQPPARLVRYAGIIAALIIVFGALYLGLLFLE